MDKIGRNDAAHLLSQQVTAARYFFLKLAPRREEPLVLVMGGRERCNPDYVISRRRFPYYVIEFVVAGRGTLELDHARIGRAVDIAVPERREERRDRAPDPIERERHGWSLIRPSAATNSREIGRSGNGQLRLRSAGGTATMPRERYRGCRWSRSASASSPRD